VTLKPANDTTPQVPEPAPALIEYTAFRDFVNTRARQLLRIAATCLPLQPEQFVLTRPLLGQVLAEATQIEELLDSYGARTNSTWHVFRSRIAALKNFSQAGYELLHVAHAAHGYNLLGRTPAFLKDTEAAIAYLAAVLLGSLRAWYTEAQSLGLTAPAEGLAPEGFTEHLPSGVLPRDRTRVHRESAQARVVTLATQFLHGTELASFLRVVSRAKPEDYASLIGDPVSEESLRGLEVRFHNLQSLYDTYVSDSSTETLDAQLPALRGHISAVLHLLRVGTILIHFYERHIRPYRQSVFGAQEFPYGQDDFLKVIMGYALGNSYRFLQMARNICREMLRRYAEIDSIEIPVPRFHGFHVRPSTLVAAIVSHYGSDVTMECGGMTYNAGVAMDFFRANEWINRQKRERVYEQVAGLSPAEIEKEFPERRQAVREILIRLAERQAIVIHRHPLPLDSVSKRPDVPFDEVLRTTIASLLTERRINIVTDIMVRLTGDKRVLADIRLLAEHGYGEDDSGNNVPLPPELGYLRHSRTL
jgi:hypothetical protein